VLSKHDGKLTYDGIQDMLYLDRVVSGELRQQDKQKFERNRSEIDDVNSNINFWQLYKTKTYMTQCI